MGGNKDVRKGLGWAALFPATPPRPRAEGFSAAQLLQSAPTPEQIQDVELAGRRAIAMKVQERLAQGYPYPNVGRAYNEAPLGENGKHNRPEDCFVEAVHAEGKMGQEVIRFFIAVPLNISFGLPPVEKIRKFCLQLGFTLGNVNLAVTPQYYDMQAGEAAVSINLSNDTQYSRMNVVVRQSELLQKIGITEQAEFASREARMKMLMGLGFTV